MVLLGMEAEGAHLKQAKMCIATFKLKRPSNPARRLPGPDKLDGMDPD